jgi:hypothetical protein
LKIVLIKAAETGVKFRVIVADSRPKLEGREMVRHLVNAGIHSTYIHVSAVAHIIKEVRVTRYINMVFLIQPADIFTVFFLSVSICLYSFHDWFLLFKTICTCLMPVMFYCDLFHVFAYC